MLKLITNIKLNYLFIPNIINWKTLKFFPEGRELELQVKLKMTHGHLLPTTKF